MTPEFQRQMTEAARLTRAGDLKAATALIQAALGSAPMPGMPAGMSRPGAGTVAREHRVDEVIDVEARVVGWGPAVDGDDRSHSASHSHNHGHGDDRDQDHSHGRSHGQSQSHGGGGGGEGLAHGHGHGLGHGCGQGQGMRSGPRHADGPTQEARSARQSTVPGQGERGRFRHPAAGQRDYLLFVPPGAATTPRPLVVMLHGCTQTAQDFAAGTRMHELAEAVGACVLYPEQSRKHNAQGCWNWFKHNHQQRGRGEPALLAGMVQQVAARHGIDRERIYVAGLSAGGAMAAILGQCYPDLFAAVGVHSGLAAGAARDLPSALAAMQQGAPGSSTGAEPVPTIVFHGDRDATVHPANAAHVLAGAGHAGAGEPLRVAASGRRPGCRRIHRAADGRIVAESWLIEGAGHAWAGGSTAGSHTDPQGPDASAEMIRFFMQHRLRR